MLLAALLVIISSGQAVARDVTRSGSYVTGKGHTGSYSSEVRGNRRDGLTRSQSSTTRSGRTANRSATTTYDRGSGTFNCNVNAPTPHILHFIEPGSFLASSGLGEP